MTGGWFNPVYRPDDISPHAWFCSDGSGEVHQPGAVMPAELHPLGLGGQRTCTRCCCWIEAA